MSKDNLSPGDYVKVDLYDDGREIVVGVLGNFNSCWVKEDYPIMLATGQTVWRHKSQITLTHRSAGLKLL